MASIPNSATHVRQNPEEKQAGGEAEERPLLPVKESTRGRVNRVVG